MGAGILQLIAKGVQDIYITGQPDITFFKIIYRRHTNFSIDEIDLNFRSKIDFGKMTRCKISRMGDLLHQLYLVIELPEIDIYTGILTNKEVKNILNKIDIEWEDNNNNFNNKNYNQIIKLIENKLNMNIENIKNNTKLLDNITKIDINQNNYRDLIFNEFIKIDLPDEFMNIDDIYNIIINKLFSNEYIIKNLEFINKINNINYSINNNFTLIKEEVDSYELYEYFNKLNIINIDTKYKFEVYKNQIIKYILDNLVNYIDINNDINNLDIKLVIYGNNYIKSNTNFNTIYKYNNPYTYLINVEYNKLINNISTKINLNIRNNNIKLIKNKTKEIFNKEICYINVIPIIINEYIGSKVDKKLMYEIEEEILNKINREIDNDKLIYLDSNLYINNRSIVKYVIERYEKIELEQEYKELIEIWENIINIYEQEINEFRKNIRKERYIEKEVLIDYINKYNKERNILNKEWIKNNIKKIKETHIEIDGIYRKENKEIINEIIKLNKLDDKYKNIRTKIIDNEITKLNKIEEYGKYIRDIIIENYIDKELIKTEDNKLIDKIEEIINRNIIKTKERIKEIIGNENKTGIIDELDRNKDGIEELANFAWIRRIGHYIIDEVGIYIGDQLIDKQTGEWLEIWRSLTNRRQKERGYNILIGDVKELTEYNNKKKKKYELIIPLQFWFCRNIGASIPLVALQHTEVDIYIKLKEFNEVAYYEENSKFRKKPKLDGKLIGQYIYVDKEERHRIATSRHEYLIELLQYNGDIEINKNTIEEDRFEVKMYFNDPVKEIIWCLQRIDYIDGSRNIPVDVTIVDNEPVIIMINTNGEQKYYNYGFEYETGEINMATKARLKFEEREREMYQKIEYYNLIEPYKYHYSSTRTGIYVYSFSLYPETYQPSGASNMSKLDETSFDICLTEKIVNLILFANVRLRVPIYATSYNILRIMSGLAGLAFII